MPKTQNTRLFNLFAPPSWCVIDYLWSAARGRSAGLQSHAPVSCHITLVQLRRNSGATNVSLQEYTVVYQGNEGVYKVKLLFVVFVSEFIALVLSLGFLLLSFF